MATSLSGRRIGSFDVGPLIGAGGMGEVYRGRDTKLNRDVAIKVLLPAVANDAERLARFNREAQVLASLNHPNIAHIHGIAEGESGPLLILEFVDGPTLADRLANGALPIDEAMAIAKQIADALEAAHERGIIHRDLKPANIKVDDSGTVKVLDFGLAKALDPTASQGGQLENSPTITSPAMTQAGLILGTAAYMSPEQAKGRVVDKRTDVWAFGCVLYEMLTGKRAFEGEDVTDTIAAVVRAEPDWSALPDTTPPQARLLIRRCLDKDRRTRIGDISVARFLLSEPVIPGSDTKPSLTKPSVARAGALAIAAMALGAAVVAAIAWSLWPRPAAGKVARFTLKPIAPFPLIVQGTDRDVAMAHDGSFFVYRSSSNSPAHLVVRSLSAIDGRDLEGTNGARLPAISPDGKWVAFFAAGQLRKVPISGGPASRLCEVDGGPRGISWGDDGNIVFSATRNGALLRVGPDGGEPVAITKPADGIVHSSPFVLPGSKAVLYTARTAANTSPSIRVVDLQTGNERALVDTGQDPAYVSGGLMLYVTAPSVADGSRIGSLRAIRFDSHRLEITGDSVAIEDQIFVGPTGVSNFSASHAGDIVYVPGSAATGPTLQRELVWVDRAGREYPIKAPRRAYASLRLSPDGSKAVLDARDQTNDIWIWDFARETLTALNISPAQDMAPIWTAEGKRIIWTATRVSSIPNLYWQSADGTGTPEPLSTSTGNQFPTSATPDGRYTIYFGTGGRLQGTDIYQFDMSDSARRSEQIIGSPSLEMGGEISPDGRWIAYHSDETRERQVIVRPFPNVNEGRTQISTDGGSRPAFSRRGDELFYLDRNGFLTAVPFTTKGTTLVPGAPKTILRTAYLAGSSALGLDLRAYDVSPDGKRFLMIKDDASSDQSANAPEMVVVLNLASELRSRLAIP
jgi:serine/threonine-protein kinase